MYRRFLLSGLVAASFLLPGIASAQDKKVLTVYTYESFVSEWGPGPKVRVRDAHQDSRYASRFRNPRQ